MRSPGAVRQARDLDDRWRNHVTRALSAALRRQNPFRRRVPLAGGARQKALPHAWRCTGVRRLNGKPERAQARPVHQGRDRRAKADSGLVERSAEIVASDELIDFRKALAAANRCLAAIEIETKRPPQLPASFVRAVREFGLLATGVDRPANSPPFRDTDERWFCSAVNGFPSISRCAGSCSTVAL